MPQTVTLEDADSISVVHPKLPIGDFMYNNSKHIGDIGEVATIYSFVRLGVPVYIPFGDNDRSDLVAEFGGKLNRIQIKTSSATEDGYIRFNLLNSTSKDGSPVLRKYDPNDIDYFALHSIAREATYLVPCVGPRSWVQVRYAPTKNNQNTGIVWENDVLLSSVVSGIL